MNTEDVVRRLKRGAADVGIDLIDLRTTTEEEEFLFNFAASRPIYPRRESFVVWSEKNKQNRLYLECL